MQQLEHITVRNQVIGIGPTARFSLRVSAATLSRVVFPHPESGVSMLAMEHKATRRVVAGESQVVVKVQPFGGAIRILDPRPLLSIVGAFNFDSERSQSEQDFRIYIEPSKWEAVRDFCLEQMRRSSSACLETQPDRELVEEFEDTLGVQLKPAQYRVERLGIVVQDEPAFTANVHANGNPTVRIYQIDEVKILDPAIWQLAIKSSIKYSPVMLRSLLHISNHETGRDRANAVYAAPLDKIRSAFLDLALDQRCKPLEYEKVLLDWNVSALFNNIPVPKYKRIGLAN